MKLSIIVPIYNVEPYLRKCIDSILTQTFTDFECILVDDGSPDNCPAICDEYAKKDSRIRVIHKENGGLSDARNAGLDIAQGEYIGFVDSDDWIHPQMYELVYKCAISTNADIAQCGYSKIKEKDSIDIHFEATQKPIVRTKDEIFKNYYSLIPGIDDMVWNKMYRKTIFDTIRFPVDRYFEDSSILFDTINASDCVAIIGTPLYFYLQRPNSIMSINYSIKWLSKTEILGEIT